jgi:hypothetical protein
MTNKKIGLAAMPVAKRKKIAGLGGKVAHEMGKAHQWTKAEASAMSQRGVIARQAKRAERKMAQS